MREKEKRIFHGLLGWPCALGNRCDWHLGYTLHFFHCVPGHVFFFFVFFFTFLYFIFRMIGIYQSGKTTSVYLFKIHAIEGLCVCNI